MRTTGLCSTPGGISGSGARRMRSGEKTPEHERGGKQPEHRQGRPGIADPAPAQAEQQSDGGRHEKSRAEQVEPVRTVVARQLLQARDRR